MKNLEIFGVQEMNTIEMKEQSGGWAWFERVANCAIKDISKVIQILPIILPPHDPKKPF